MGGTRISRLPPRLLRAWRRSDYEAAGAVARIGRRSPDIDRLLAEMGTRQAVFLGAWNPGGCRVGPGRNRAAEQRLLALTRGLTRRAGYGALGAWREPHLLLVIAPRRAARLARALRQAGMVVVRRGARARLVVLA